MSEVQKIEKYLTLAHTRQNFLRNKIKALDVRLAFGMEEYLDDPKEAIRKAYRPPKYFEVAEDWMTEMRDMKPSMEVDLLDTDDEQGKDKAIGISQVIQWIEHTASSEDAKDEAWEDACKYGTGFIYDYWDFKNKKPVSEYIDIREVFIDPRFKKINECQWFARGRKYTKKEFQELFSIFEDDDNTDFFERLESIDEQKEKNNGGVPEEDEIRVYDYYSLEEKKQYIIGCVGNGKEGKQSILHSDDYILSKLPITPYYHIKKNTSFWGVSPIEKGSSSIDLQINMVNMAINAGKMSMQKSFFVDGNSGLSSATKIRPNSVTIVTNNGAKGLKDMTQEIDFSADLSGFDYINSILERDSIMATKVDDSLNAPIEQKVGNTKAKRETRSKKINGIVEKAMMGSEKWRWEHLIEMAQKIIIPAWEAEKENINIKVKGFFVVNDDESNAGFIKNGGAEGVFYPTEKNTKGNFTVIARKPKNKAVLSEEKQRNFVQMLDFIQRIAGINPEVLSNLDFNGVIEQMFEMFDIPKEDILKNSNDKGRNLIDEEHKRLEMIGEIELPDEETPEESQKHLLAHMKYLNANKERLEGKTLASLLRHIQETTKRVKGIQPVKTENGEQIEQL